MRGIEYQMKKIICLITAALLCLSAVGCGSKKESGLADTSKEIVVILYDNDEYNSSVKDSFIENIYIIFTAS